MRINFLFIKLFKIKLLSAIRYCIYKFFNHYAWPRRLSCRLFDFDFYYPSGLLINLGAGPYFKRRGWLSIDFIAGHDKQLDSLRMDLREFSRTSRFNDVRAFYISHTLEHFHINEGRRLLSSIYNTMKSGGYLRIVVPDSDLILNLAKEGDCEYFRPFFSCFKKVHSDEIKPLDIVHFFLCTPRYKINDLGKHSKANTKSKIQLLDLENDAIIASLNNHSYSNKSDGSYHLAAYNQNLLFEILKEIGFSKVYKSAFMQSRFGPMREAPIFDGTHPWLSLYIEAIK